MRSFYHVSELDYYSKIHTLSGFFPKTLQKVWLGLLFFSGGALLPPLIMLRRTLLDRRIRFLVLCVLILIAGMGIQIYFIPHYIAPFTAAFYALGLQAMRHLRQWSPEGKPVGMTLARLTVTLCFLMVGMRLYAGPLHLALIEWPPSYWNFSWYGPDHFGTERARVERDLDQLPGKQLAIVRYSSVHNPLDEWVYNAADIDNSRVVWAREMDAPADLELIRYYRDRKVWLVQPDSAPATLARYTAPE
jgi:hypothetical protein